MSLLGASRFAAMLVTIAVCGTAGSLAWIIVTRTDLKSGTARSADHASLTRSTSHTSHLKNERSNKVASFRNNERPRASGWSDELGQWRERSSAPRILVDYTNPGLRSGGADMPLPAPPMTRSDTETWAKRPEPAVFTPASAVENPQRLRDPKPEPATSAATPNSPKGAARSYYLEKFVEQGDAGEVKFRYRRRPCEPPNMPDVCFMPQASRRNIVVERR